MDTILLKIVRDPSDKRYIIRCKWQYLGFIGITEYYTEDSPLSNWGVITCAKLYRDKSEARKTLDILLKQNELYREEE